MKTSIATVSISGNLSQKLDAIANAGFDGVEIFETDFLTSDLSPAQVGRMVRDVGLELTLFQPFRDFEGMPEPHRARAFDRAERKFDLMQEMGAELILVCSNVSTASLGGIDRAAEDFWHLGERAKARSIRVGYEALAWGRHINDHRDAWEIVRRADHPHVGLILDSFHTLARKIDVKSIRSIPKDKLFLIQLADAPKMDMDFLFWSRHFRNMPGEGDLPVTDFLRAVAATGYDGYLSLEVFNDQFRGGPPKTIARDGWRSLIYLMDQAKRDEPLAFGSVPAIPDRIDVSGVEFIEFTANENDAEALATFFRSLGFRKVGHHISKAVTLYRQGEINLLINTDMNGFAHSAYVVHGTSAYAIGLKVGDCRATVERALALGAEIFEQPVGPDEMMVPGIRGVGGSILYFIDTNLAKIWESEFITIDEPQWGAGLLRIDHVGQTMLHDEMLTWILFYTSIFATKKAPQIDIVDPAGLVRSQAIESQGGLLRLTLNGADNRRSFAGNFVAESFGSSIQHIAFATNDIFKTAARLAEIGFEPLDISPNYYEDVEARFGLAPDFTQTLQQANILYDRDEHGEYLQLYGPSVGEGFFFEIVERRGYYEGYGAPNAIFRIAAQKRHMRPLGMPAYNL